MFFVINTRRSDTNTLEKIEKMIYNIESSSRLKVSKLVNNTNLLYQTSVSDIIEGNEIIKRVSLNLEIPIGFTSGFYNNNLIEGALSTEFLYLRKLIKLPWD